MRLNSKWAWGLAWAGLAVVVAVPSADFLTGKGSKTAALLTSSTDAVAPVKTASVTTSVTSSGIKIIPAGSTPDADPVSSYLKTNKSLPSYISGGASSSVDPVQTATIDPTPQIVAPVPFPAPPPAFYKTTPAPTGPIVADIPTNDQPVIVDDPNDDRLAYADDNGPVPPEPIGNGRSPTSRIGLQQYLDQNGLLSDSSGRSSASVTIVNRDNSTYDSNGFFLSDGPNNERARRRARFEQMLQDENDDSSGFTLF